ncbi:MAG: hypothetical protein JWM11_5587 [Planctomycetaceae bacterium]|nr:hypothetical protein [Planctomycetaceae bacterium]
MNCHQNLAKLSIVLFAAPNDSFSILIPAIKRLILNREWYYSELVQVQSRPILDRDWIWISLTQIPMLNQSSTTSH